MIKLSAFNISLKTSKDKNATFVIIFQVCLVLCSVVGTLFPFFLFLLLFSYCLLFLLLLFLFFFFVILPLSSLFFYFFSSSFFLFLQLFFLLPFVLFFCFFFFFFVRFLLRAHLSKIVLFREPHLQRSSLVRKTNGLKSCWIVTITFLGGWCLFLWCGWQWCWWTAKAMAMMMISMELKARVARFSPKMIAKTLAGRFSHNLQHWHFKKRILQGQHLGW